jgi:hypothetical protein
LNTSSTTNKEKIMMHQKIMKNEEIYKIPRDNPIYPIAHRTLTYVGHTTYHVHFSDLGLPTLKACFRERCEAAGFPDVAV